MPLDNDSTSFSSLIINTSEKFNIAHEYVEKDCWLFLLLKEIFKNSERGYVFKGGKCVKNI